MKPQKVIELVEVEYWTCNVPEHRHKTLAVAQACIAKKSSQKKPVRRWSVSEMADAFEAILDGATFKQVAEPHGITAGRMKQVIGKVRRMAMHPTMLKEGFPDHDYGSIFALRDNAAFWRNQLDKLREHYKVQKNA
jgi:hypothetical protein